MKNCNSQNCNTDLENCQQCKRMVNPMQHFALELCIAFYLPLYLMNFILYILYTVHQKKNDGLTRERKKTYSNFDLCSKDFTENFFSHFH